MKIGIKNYRTVKNAELDIVNNQINYLLGGNESGKTNVLNALRIPDLDNQEDLEVTPKDRTIIKQQHVKEKIAVIVQDAGAVNSFSSTGPSEVSWFYIDSEKKKEYLNLIKEKVIDDFPKYESLLNGKFARAEITEEQKDKIYASLENLKDGNYVKRLDRKEISDTLPEFNKLFEALSEVLKEMKILYPRVIYVEPIIKAKIKGKISYDYKSLFDQNSTLGNICQYFLSDEQKAGVSRLQEQFENEEERGRFRRSVFSDLNKNVKKFFEKFKHVRAYPEFNSEESQVVLDVLSKDSWEIDSADENERSLGYKSFLRIVTELIATSSSTKKTLYIIDEPEQSLHPYLQTELLATMREVLKKNDKLTILLVTHSPYMILMDNDFDIDAVSFVNRDGDGSTKINSMKDKEKITKLLKEFMDGDNTEANYLFKILMDSSAWNKKIGDMSNYYTFLLNKLVKKEITPQEFLEKSCSPLEFETYILKSKIPNK